MHASRHVSFKRYADNGKQINLETRGTSDLTGVLSTRCDCEEPCFDRRAFADQQVVRIRPACIETGRWSTLDTPYDVIDASSLVQPADNEL